MEQVWKLCSFWETMVLFSWNKSRPYFSSILCRLWLFFNFFSLGRTLRFLPCSAWLVDFSLGWCKSRCSAIIVFIFEIMLEVFLRHLLSKFLNVFLVNLHPIPFFLGFIKILSFVDWCILFALVTLPIVFTVYSTRVGLSDSKKLFNSILCISWKFLASYPLSCENFLSSYANAF